MNYHVTNENLCVGKIDILSISSSSLLLVGDSQTIQLASSFDTPPESLILVPLVPLAPKG